MEYNDIMKITDIDKKQESLIKYYNDIIQINDWLTITPEIEKIRFNDRTEYKLNGQLHRLDGPAIDYHSGIKGFFYLFGKVYPETEWKVEAKQILRRLKYDVIMEKES